MLDLGSGGGMDVLMSARRVGPEGHAYGVDMTDEMLALAEANKARSGLANATFLKGTIEEVPLVESLPPEPRGKQHGTRLVNRKAAVVAGD